MIVCDHENKIIALDSSKGGAAHDSFVWNSSEVHQFLQNKYEEQHYTIRLLGDSGYPLQPWLLTPYRRALEGSGEIRFNSMHSKARSIVERSIGILKGRWRSLCSDRRVRFSPEIVAKMVNVCAALHNACLFYKIGLEESNIVNTAEEENNSQISSSSDSAENPQRRATIIRDTIRDSM